MASFEWVVSYFSFVIGWAESPDDRIAGSHQIRDVGCLDLIRISHLCSTGFFYGFCMTFQ